MSEAALPLGWARTTIGMIADTQLGKTLNGSAQTGTAAMPYLRNINVRWGAFDLSDLKEMDIFPDERDQFTVSRGDVLVCEGGQPGRCGVWTSDQEVGFQNALHRLRPCGGINPQFLALQIRHQVEEHALDHLFSGVTIKHFSQSKLRTVDIYLPPQAEQERIVAELERRLSHIDQAIRGIQHARAQIRLAKMALLQNFVLEPRTSKESASAAWNFLDEVCERLGRQAEPSGKRDEDLPVVTLGDVLVRIEAGKSYACDGRPANDDESGVVKVSAMSWGSFLEEENKAIPPSITPRKQDEIHEGDLLLSRANTDALVGASVLVGDCRERLFLSDKSLRLVTAEGISKQWLLAVLAAPHLRAQMTALASGTKESMRNITQPNLRKVSFPLLSPLDQQAAIAELSRKLSLLEAADRSADSSLRRAEQLRRSLLAAAFSGKLVPQDPNDEPAEVLLEKISAEREAAAAAAKAAKTATKTTKKPAVRKTSVRKKETQS